MEKEKASFKEFLSAVAPEDQAFVEKLNTKLIEQGSHKKCRNDGMFFLLTNETAEHIAELVCAEVNVRKSAL